MAIFPTIAENRIARLHLGFARHTIDGRSGAGD
jgi:hypothetical protein